MIQCERLTKLFRGVRPVDDVSFETRAGECVGLLGLNGAGKTTLLRMISAVLTPTSGQLSIAGADVTEEAHSVRRQIGYLPENPPVYGEMTVEGFLAFAAGLRRVPRGRVAERIARVGAQCQLEGVLHRRIEHLSFGYRKRVGIAQAIIHQPALVILDEPIAGLDPAQIVSIRELLLSLKGTHTVILSSHMLGEIGQLCDQLLVMHLGRVVACGAPTELFGSPEHTITVVATLGGRRERVVQALEQLDGVLQTEVSAGENNTVKAEVKIAADKRPELSRTLIEAGLDLFDLQQKRDELETLFLRLTGEPTGERS